MGADGSVTVAAPAKVNLYLHVTGRRDDGYHLLDTLVVFPGLGDVVTVGPSTEITLTTEGPFADQIPAGPDNLVLKAAYLLANHAGIIEGAKIILDKNLPVASGIGGGSADAAATLSALSKLWGLSLSENDLAKLGLTLGADVPMCVKGRALFVGGIGEDFADAPKMPEAALVLVNPLKPVSTPAVFKERTGAFKSEGRFEGPVRDAAHLAELLSTRTNDLADAARRLEPQVGNVLDEVASLPGVLLTRMSGSGGTCFGLFQGIDSAAQAAKTLGKAQPGWWVKAAPLEFNPGNPFAGT
ncbi:MAG: 4-(cytidine 5'-diphospho)-2-C-methyl-D-erythritol kinase [Rhodospirillaceae bacterium]|jgi:4-diphosphocytidyl-2-C-methyl-D-erythritol kinase|nr:4-(cytidine 5'-diphospho)-2-C-methyl-D-erythritol kinase [Rhodospirillales bacterium]MBT3906326.1 4-(cytidine 5'-diphospho)-2-C-methyl-D-erythritol kinase [Rhodospirillaceae bacterium]MBT5034610.1 4-(cytidine 5'-diphospho)-2-C-methyl-D-erythritol kinase [Rhodospirillaceae bacterium]MBT6218304.1 4-(cytidine 5'-diphospho)-2-C-methyl-D-erythritol kinase [Rhodospirillaceae bacterium]MBT6361476.1 4-(cytidine 5'-diphospho)-2-C-methyl-D-erythritol kinase [Rhodospirillaceae bacterium]